MDRKKSLLNVGVSIGFKLLLLVASFADRRFLISSLGNNVNGLNALYNSIIGVLSVAELGIGSAITFSMYRPIVNHENEKVAALYQLFRKLYLFIGVGIFVVGLAITPFLPRLTADYAEINENVYLTFLLSLLTTVITYVFSCKVSLINAYKDNYITTTIHSVSFLIRYTAQIVVAITTKSFVLYLVCAIIATILNWGFIDIACKRKHLDILEIKKVKLEKSTKKEITNNIKAMFMHKIGSALVNSADSIIISTFIGVVILGKYSNYATIAVSLTGVISLFFTPLTSIIGHMCIKESKNNEIQYFHFFHSFNFIIGTVFFLGYYAIVDNLISLMFGNNLELSRTVAFVITLNQFIQFMRQGTLLFRDATGTFYHDRWKSIFEGVLNVGLDVLFVTILPDDQKVAGVLVATIITNLLICHIVEPYVLYKYEFKKSAIRYFIKNYFCIVLFTSALLLLNLFLKDYGNQWTELFVNGLISIAVSAVICTLVLLIDGNFRNHLIDLLKKSPNSTNLE